MEIRNISCSTIRDGNVLDKRDVSGDKDDTHWPVSKLLKSNNLKFIE